jgi:hypothetical protein
MHPKAGDGLYLTGVFVNRVIRYFAGNQFVDVSLKYSANLVRLRIVLLAE